jgi:hypothetical protein
LGETKCVDFATRKLLFQQVKLFHRSGRFRDLKTRSRLDQQGAIHVKDEKPVSDCGAKSFVRTRYGLHGILGLEE